MLEHKWEEKVI